MAEPLSDVDALLGALVEGVSPEESARRLAQLVNRAVTRLHTLARGEANARKEQPEWPQWAQLQNASRTLVLQASTCRDLATRLAQRESGGTSPGGGGGGGGKGAESDS